MIRLTFDRNVAEELVSAIARGDPIFPTEICGGWTGSDMLMLAAALTIATAERLCPAPLLPPKVPNRHCEHQEAVERSEETTFLGAAGMLAMLIRMMRTGEYDKIFEPMLVLDLEAGPGAHLKPKMVSGLKLPAAA